MKAVLRLCFCFFVLASFNNCGGDPASTSEVPDLSVVMSKLLPTAREQEQNWRGKLMNRGQTSQAILSEVTVGSPDEIGNALAAIVKLNAELNEKKEAADEPVKAAQAAFDELSGAAPGYYTNTSRRCGSDGCGGVCEEKCRADEVCRGNWCSCVPDCVGKVCGSDGCGGFCGAGVCEEGSACDKDGQCIAHETKSNTCKPECRRQVEEFVSRQWSVPKVRRDQGTTRRTRAYRYFENQDELGVFIAALKAKSTAHGAELARIAGLQGQLEQAQAAESQMKDKRKALGEQEKTLKKADREAQKAARKAKRKTPEEAPALEAAAEQAKAALTQVRDERKALAQSLKEKGKEIRDLKKEVNRGKKTAKTLTPAKAKLDAELARLVAAKQALQARADAAAALEAAKEKASADKEALDESYAPKLAAAKKKLKDLKQPAFPARIVPVWNGSSPTAATSSLVVRIGEGSRLAGYLSALRKTRSHWVSRYKASGVETLAKLAAAKESDAEIDPEDNFWTRTNALMHDQIVICEQLLESTERLVSIQDAMKSARERSGQ